MPKQEPKSRPAPPKPPRRRLTPKPDTSVYGGQWGSSGKQAGVDPEAAERLEPQRPARKQT